MDPAQDRLTLDALLADPLTQLVMRSDNLTTADVAQAFDEARAGILCRHSHAYRRPLAAKKSAAEGGMRWSGC